MKEVTLTKPKGDPIGFKVSNYHHDQIIEITEFLRDHNVEINNIQCDFLNSANRILVGFTHPTSQLKIHPWTIVAGYYVFHDKERNDFYCSNSVESEGYIIVDGEVFESSEEIHALQITEFHNMVDLFQQVFEWGQMHGYTLDSFNNTEHGFSVVIDEEKSDVLSVGDYLFFDDKGHLVTYGRDNLKEDGYEVQRQQ